MRYRALFMFCFVVNVVLAVWNIEQHNGGLLALNLCSIALFGIGLRLTK